MIPGTARRRKRGWAVTWRPLILSNSGTSRRNLRGIDRSKRTTKAVVLANRRHLAARARRRKVYKSNKGITSFAWVGRGCVASGFRQACADRFCLKFVWGESGQSRSSIRPLREKKEIPVPIPFYPTRFVREGYRGWRIRYRTSLTTRCLCLSPP